MQAESLAIRVNAVVVEGVVARLQLKLPPQLRIIGFIKETNNCGSRFEQHVKFVEVNLIN